VAAGSVWLKEALMFYERPVYRPLGDMFVGVEFGDELHLALNFMVIALDLSLKRQPIRGVTEMVPTNRTLMIAYDSTIIRQADLIRALQERESEVTTLRRLSSRVVAIPVWYNDPWSQECARAHGMPNNMEYLAELNGTTVDGIIQLHSGVEWWVSSVGFQPGTYQALPLDPGFTVSAPKYPRPRKRTPARILCQAGKVTSFYPVASPGGYQLLGRTPIELYDPQQRNDVFKDGPVLPIVGERHRYLPINEAQYHEIRQQVERGDYRYDIRDGEYSLDEYLAREKAYKERVSPC
jgi:urea carboxylase